MQAIGAGHIRKFVDGAKLARVQAPKSEAQAEAGNYRKAHIRAFGLDIAIENPKGTIRRKLTPDGEEKWRVKMPAHYGYLKGFISGADGDHIDCYIGDDQKAPLVWIVDQIKHWNGQFDEHKCLLGFSSYEDALKAYDGGFSDGKGPDRRGAVVEMDLAEFRDWLENGDSSKPLAYDGALAKAWDASKHPRDHGRFTGAGSDAWAGKPPKEKRAAIEAAQEKMTRLLDRHTAAFGPLERASMNEVAAILDPKIGPIDFRVGQPGTAAKSYDDGHGIAHIVAKRKNVDGKSPEEIRQLLLAVPRVIANGERSTWFKRGADPRDRSATGDRMTIDTPSIRVVLLKPEHSASNPFVLTAFYRDKNQVRKGMDEDVGPETPRWAVAPSAEPSALRANGQRVVSRGGEEVKKLSESTVVGKRWAAAPFAEQAALRTLGQRVVAASGPQRAAAPTAEPTALRAVGQRVVSHGGEAATTISPTEIIGKAWVESQHLRDAIGRFSSKGGARAAIGVGIAAAGLGLSALAAKFLKPGHESKPIVNETSLWAEHNLRSAETAERMGRPDAAKIHREAVRMAEDEPIPVKPSTLGGKARLPSDKLAKPVADAIGGLMTGQSGAKWERRADGLVLGSDGPDGIQARSLYQDRNGQLIARIDLAIQHQDGVGAIRAGLKKEVEAYKALGVDQVALHANMEIGAYAWARMGFVPGPRSWDALRADLRGFLKTTSVYEPAVKDQLLGLLKSKNPKTVWKIADARRGSVNVGRELLAGQHWFGALPLNDAQAMKRFNTYVSQKKG